jgi:hypothetical protein
MSIFVMPGKSFVPLPQILHSEIYASAQSIMFSKKVCYFFVRPTKTFLEVRVFDPRKIEGLISMHGPAKKVGDCNLGSVNERGDALTRNESRVAMKAS